MWIETIMNGYENIKNPKLREKVVHQLLHEKKEWMWSYDVMKLDPNKIPDKIIIEKLLLLGDLRDWENLKQIYDKEVLYSQWMENIVPYHMYQKKQVEMARFFFDIPNPETFLKKARKNHLANAIAGGH